MPNERLDNNRTLTALYTKLFGARSEAEAQQKVNALVQKLDNAYQENLRLARKSTQERDLEKKQAQVVQKAQNWLCTDAYEAYTPMIKQALDHNVLMHLNGLNTERTVEDVVEDFALFTRGIGTTLEGRNVHGAPDADVIYSWAYEDNSADDDTPCWLSAWENENLSQLPQNKVDLEKMLIYGKNVQTGKKLSVREAAAKAELKMRGICKKMIEDLSGAKEDFVEAEHEKLHHQKCVEAVSLLRAVEREHASRGFFWRIFNFRQYSYEERAIQEMRAQMQDVFFEREIEAVTDEDLQVSWESEERADANINSENYLGKHIEEMKQDPMESKQTTEQRAKEEEIISQREKKELEDVAIHQDFADTEKFEIDDAEWEHGGKAEDFEKGLENEVDAIAEESSAALGGEGSFDDAEWEDVKDVLDTKPLSVEEAEDEKDEEIADVKDANKSQEPLQIKH